MAVVRPFKAIRPRKEYAEKVVSLPYDVMNREEAEKMAQGNPYSFLHISRAEIDLPLEDPYSAKVYEKAKENIKEGLSKQILQRDGQKNLYIYRQTMNGNRQTGIVGCVSVDDYEKNVIKKHEFTRVEKEIDRINHFDVCNANTEPVFLTYKREEKIDQYVNSYIMNHEVEYDFVTADGVRHELWVIDDKEITDKIVDLFEQVEKLYIADGHHRSASACKVGEKRRSENPGFSGEEEFNFFMAVIFPDSDLKIFDYNRVIKDLNGLSVDEFIARIKKAGFEVEAISDKPYKPIREHEFAMYLQEQWYRINATSAIIPDDLIGALDVSILQDSLLEPILGIKDPRTDNRIDFIGGIRGMEELERRVNSDMKVAFAVYPVKIEQLLEIADNQLIMPPKSTWFEPKLGSGLFVHEL